MGFEPTKACLEGKSDKPDYAIPADYKIASEGLEPSNNWAENPVARLFAFDAKGTD